MHRKSGRMNYGETWNWDLRLLLASKTKERWAITKNFFKINPSCSEYRPVHWRASMWRHQSKSMHVSIPFKKSTPDFAAIKTGKSPPPWVSVTCSFLLFDILEQSHPQHLEPPTPIWLAVDFLFFLVILSLIKRELVFCAIFLWLNMEQDCRWLCGTRVK